MAHEEDTIPPQVLPQLTKWSQWPADRPRPTEEEYAVALERYKAECKELVANGYQGDQLCGLDFTMATYSRDIWWGYFFPDEKRDIFAGLTLGTVPGGIKAVSLREPCRIVIREPGGVRPRHMKCLTCGTQANEGEELVCTK